MPGGGSKPGERRGGRQRGVPNRTTIERAAVIAEDARQKAQKLGLDVAREAMNFLMGLAAKHQATDEKLSAKYAEKGGNFGLRVAEFETPKLQSTTLLGTGSSGEFVHRLEVEIVPRRIEDNARTIDGSVCPAVEPAGKV